MGVMAQLYGHVLLYFPIDIRYSPSENRIRSNFQLNTALRFLRKLTDFGILNRCIDIRKKIHYRKCCYAVFNRINMQLVSRICKKLNGLFGSAHPEELPH